MVLGYIVKAFNPAFGVILMQNVNLPFHRKQFDRNSISKEEHIRIEVVVIPHHFHRYGFIGAYSHKLLDDFNEAEVNAENGFNSIVCLF